MSNHEIKDPSLKAALTAIRATMEAWDLAGALILVSPDEAAITYKMDATWSACRADPMTEMGFQLVAMSRKDGLEVSHARLEAAVHTIIQMAEFGSMTQRWMTDLKGMLAKNGFEFEHPAFGGEPVPKPAA